MTYVRIEDDMHENRKVRSVSFAARWSYVASICRSGNKRTDGFLATFDLGLVDGDRKIVKELEGAGLWEPRSGGWYVHDYLLHNRSNEQIAAAAETARQNGKRGLASRYANLLDALPSNPLDKPPENVSSPLSKPAGHNARSVSSGISLDLITKNDRGIQSISSKPPSNPPAVHKAVDPAYLAEIQPQHPTVNVVEVYADACNRKTWDGYKDKRRALGKYIGWAEEKVEEKRNGRVSQNGRASTRSPYDGAGIVESGERYLALHNLPAGSP